MEKAKLWNGRKYWWCSPETGGHHDGKWVQHKPSDCNPKRIKKSNNGSTGKGGSTQSDGKKPKHGKSPKLVVTQEARVILEKHGIDINKSITVESDDDE
mmetsp:Transcript_6489/g.18273  ORF Transcript_6489/g.18273 Transcript_6489/m.18273 type:complete len:99 (+) Transcript_6489:596-892(+)